MDGGTPLVAEAIRGWAALAPWDLMETVGNRLVGFRVGAGAGHNRGSGRKLGDPDAGMAEGSTGLLDVTRLRAMWAELRTLPEVDAEVMCHGDLIPPNVLVRGNRLAGILDSGGFAAADPALDLVSAWHLLDDDPRRVLRQALGCSDVQWRRGMAWAFQQATGLVWYYAKSNPIMSTCGRRTLQRLTRART